MSKGIMISCFDVTCNMARPWADAGYLCYCVDMQHEAGEQREGNIIRVGVDILDWIPPRGNIVFASFQPPCTDLASSGARWFKDKGLTKLWKAIRLFDVSVRIAESLACPYVIENPVSTISTYWRKPDIIAQPCDFGEPYTKKTCFWLGSGCKKPIRNYVNATEGSKMHVMSSRSDRSKIRSATPVGIGVAFYNSNREE